MSIWVPELCETMPKEFMFLSDGTCVQRKDIHEVTYHSLDGYQSFKGYECYRRLITWDEYKALIEERYGKFEI